MLPAVLLLGERSPYGLSVALPLLASGSIAVRRVVVPSVTAWETARRRAERSSGRPDLASGLRRRLSRARGFRFTPATPPDGGEPVRPLVLDPGVTAERLEEDCAARGVPWLRADGVRDGRLTGELLDERFDLLLSAAFPMILDEALLGLPRRAAINFHPSLLPRCRGCHPIFWTLASGETQGGVTAHVMTLEVDAGDVLAQIPLPLTEHDDYGSLYRRAMRASADLVGMVERALLAGQPPVPQDEARATYFHEDGPEDHRVRWAGSSPREVLALARTGLAFTEARGERLGLVKAIEVVTVARERRSVPPGRIIAVSDAGFEVAVAGGAVLIETVEWRGLIYAAGPAARALGLKRDEAPG